MQLYSAYGLTFASALPLPDMLTGEGRADVHIWIDRREPLELREDSPIQCVSVSPSRVQLSWGLVGELLIEDGRQITVMPAQQADDESLRLFLLGAGLGVLLHQRGLLVLHASGVAIRDRAVAFVGAKGWGKSTTASALDRLGYPLVTDELLVIRFDERGRAMAIPGSSQIKLWGDALIVAGEDPESAEPVVPGANKYYVSASSVARRDVPMSRLYLLDGGENLCLKPMSLGEAFFGIVPHVYVSRFGTSFMQSANATHTFKQVNALLKVVSVARLLRRPDLSQLNDIARLVETDILQEGSLMQTGLAERSIVRIGIPLHTTHSA